MFPWEKRQMDGRNTPLRTWEKLYWGVFVTAISLLLFNRLKPDPEQDKVAQQRCAVFACIAYVIANCQVEGRHHCCRLPRLSHCLNRHATPLALHLLSLHIFSTQACR